MPAELYGPFGALAALTFVVIALIRGDLVPGFIYRREIARVEKLDTAAAETAVALAALAKAGPNGNGNGAKRG